MMSSRILSSANENMQNWKVRCNFPCFAFLIIISFFSVCSSVFSTPTKGHSRFHMLTFRHVIISCHKIAFSFANVCRIVDHPVSEVSANLGNWPTDFMGQSPSRESDVMKGNFGINFWKKKRYARTRKTYQLLAIAVTRKPAALQSKQIQRFSSLLYLFIGNYSLTDLQVFHRFWNRY